MNLEILMIVSVVVAAVGSLSAQALRRSDSPYLMTVTGSRTHLLLIGGLIWVTAIMVGLLAMVTVSLVVPSLVAVALFFGIEAVALDIGAHRIDYQRDDVAERHRAHAPATYR